MAASPDSYDAAGVRGSREFLSPAAAALAFAAFAVAAPGQTSAAANDEAMLLSKTGKALEDQLACLSPPKPGLAIRAMIANGLVKKTKLGADGAAVLVPTGDLYVFGKRVKFIAGWEMEGGVVKEPFWRAPGTLPPDVFLDVILDASPEDVHYTETPHSVIRAADESYSKTGTIISCSWPKDARTLPPEVLAAWAA